MFKFRSIILPAIYFTAKLQTAQTICKPNFFQFNNRKVCEQCLTAQTDGFIQYGNNIQHYKSWEIIDWEGRLPDFTKFILFGQDQFTFACIANLRKNGFLGQIVLITQQDSLPYKKKQLISNINDKQQNLVIKNKEFYQNYKVKIKKKIQIQQISFNKSEIKFKGEYNKTKYDKMFVSVQSKTIMPFINGATDQNIERIQSIQQFRKLQNKLKISKSIHIFGGTLQSIELYQKLKKQYPNNKITISFKQVSENLKQYLPQNSLCNLNLIQLKNNTATFKKQVKQYDQISQLNLNKSVQYIQKTADLFILHDKKYNQIQKFYKAFRFDTKSRILTNIYNQGTSDNVYFSGASSKKAPYNVEIQNDTLDSIHNIVFNFLQKRSDFIYPSIQRFKLTNNYVYFMGQYQQYDHKYSIDDVTYFLKNKLLVGAISQNSRKILMLKQALAIDLVPIINQQIDIAKLMVQKLASIQLPRKYILYHKKKAVVVK